MLTNIIKISGSLLIILLLSFSCEKDPWAYKEPEEDLNQYIVFGTVMRDSSALALKSVYLYIEDPKYLRWQTEFECKSDYQGKYKFIVTYKPWDGYFYQLHTSGKLHYGQIKFGQVDRVDFNL